MTYCTLFHKIMRKAKEKRYIEYDREFGVIRCNLCNYEIFVGFGREVRATWFSALGNMYCHIREKHPEVYEELKHEIIYVKTSNC